MYVLLVRGYCLVQCLSTERRRPDSAADEQTVGKQRFPRRQAHPFVGSMALRAFHSNPCLGGFGGESSGSFVQEKDQSDAFAQIIKELVDNAVDACSGAKDDAAKTRVRISLEDQPESMLRITVSDNGCGMPDIQECVSAFSSTKTHQTAGRYGIGLTLCLLHAQRLVPKSCASITSATRDSKHFMRAKFVVDATNDQVKCVEEKEAPKSNRNESGTAVSLLLPVSLEYHPIAIT